LNKNDELISLGFCQKPHGIKGEAVLNLHSGNNCILKAGDTLLASFLEENKADKELVLEKIRYGNKVIATFKEILNRTDMEKLIPFEIKVPRNIFPVIEDPNEFYVSDILGLDVYDYSTKKKVGIIKDFYENGVQVIYVIKGEKDQFELPFVEQFSPVVSLEENRIEVVLPEIIDEKS